MEIDAVTTQTGQLVNLLAADQPAEQDPDQTPEAGEPTEPTPPADESSVEQTSEDTDDDGVLRLLLEGHFKGVADVRLHINFFNELAAIEAAQLQAVAEENVDGVLQAVEMLVGTLAEESEPAVEPPVEPPVELPVEPPVELPVEPLVEPTVEPTVESAGEPTPEVPAEVLELQETFALTVNQLKDDFLAAEAPSTDALVAGMQSAFDEFLAALEEALASDTGDVTADETAPDDGGDEPGSVEAAAEQGGGVTEPPPEEPETGLEDFIAELRAAFGAAMDELINLFGGVIVFGELSEPSGNGGAYEKFLAIYNEMLGVETPDAGPQTTETLL
ncbi:MAG: hypothetical protein ACYS9C_14205 [Planctomycetota bacterium]|jgi:hypothetical protein